MSEDEAGELKRRVDLLERTIARLLAAHDEREDREHAAIGIFVGEAEQNRRD